MVSEVVSEVEFEADLDEGEGCWVFEGVDYTLDTKDNGVYDDELTELGRWDPESNKIEWNSTTNAKLHRVRKLRLKKHERNT